MRPTLFFALALAVTGSVAADLQPARADDATGLRKQIQSAYDKRDAALRRFDIEGYLAVYDPHYRDATGKAPREALEEQRQAIITILQHVQPLTRQESVQSLTTYPDGVAVTIKATTSGTLVNPKSGQKKAYSDTEEKRAFWVHTRMGWRIKQERTLS